jgi:creatinine amidohydrolase
MRLDEMTWKQAEQYFAGDVLAVLPVGSVEQHGPIGPLGTDYLIPAELARRLEERLDVLVLPAMPYGVSPYHMSFPGTVNIGHDTLRAVVANITSSLMLHGVRRFLILNGHGGNTPAIEAVCLDVYRRGGLTALVEWWSLAPQLNPAWLGGHGDGQEASAIMAAYPGLVDKGNLFAGEANHLSPALTNIHLNAVKFRGATVKIIRDVRDVMPTGAFGGPDPSAQADAAVGAAMLAAVTDYIAAFAAEFKKAALPAERE